MYAFKKTNASNLGTWWSKNQEVGNPDSVLSVLILLLSAENSPENKLFCIKTQKSVTLSVQVRKHWVLKFMLHTTDIFESKNA